MFWADIAWESVAIFLCKFNFIHVYVKIFTNYSFKHLNKLLHEYMFFPLLRWTVAFP